MIKGHDWGAIGPGDYGCNSCQATYTEGRHGYSSGDRNGVCPVNTENAIKAERQREENPIDAAMIIARMKKLWNAHQHLGAQLKGIQHTCNHSWGEPVKCDTKEGADQLWEATCEHCMKLAFTYKTKKVPDFSS
jgi:hypothetical protein